MEDPEIQQDDKRESGPLLDLTKALRDTQRSICLRWSIFAAEVLAAVLISSLVVWVIAHLLFRFSPDAQQLVRVIYIGIGVLALGSMLAVVLRQTPERCRLALQMEAVEPAFKGALLSAVEAIERPAEVPPAVATIAAERALRVLEGVGLRFRRPVGPWLPVHLWLVTSLSVLLGVAGWLGPAFKDVFVGVLLDAGPTMTAAATRFEVVRPGRTSVVQGDAIEVEAELSGEEPYRVSIQIRDARKPGVRYSSQHSLFADRKIWRGSLDSISAASAYRLLAYAGIGGETPVAVTPWYGIDVRPTARIKALSAAVKPPRYSRLPVRRYKQPTSITVLRGSVIEVLAEAGPGKDLAGGIVELPGGGQVKAERIAAKTKDAHYVARFTATKSGVARLSLEASQAAKSGVHALLTVKVTEDRAPVADALIRDGTLPGEKGLPVSLNLRDDLGLVSARIVLRPVSSEQVPVGGQMRDITRAIPLPQNARERKGIWHLPASGLEPWLISGFKYQVEVRDSAEPMAQTGRSAWRTWKPEARDKPYAESPGLLSRRMPRRLARKNALRGIPDLTSEQASALGDLGSGRRTSRSRPKTERLEDPLAEPRSPGPSSGGQRPRGDAKRPGASGVKDGSDAYEKPEKPGSGKGSDASPIPGPGGDEKGRAGGEGPETAGATDGDRKRSAKPGDGSPESGKQSGKGSEEGGRGSGDRSEGEDGSQESETGSLPPDSSSGGRGGGAGGPKPRDGGPKSGDEPGDGGGEMAPPDLDTLSRMRGTTVDDVRAYAEKKPLPHAHRDFGTRRPNEQISSVQDSNKSIDRPFSFATSEQRGGSSKGARKRNVGVRMERVDPMYKALVESYFRKTRKSN